MIQAQNCPVCQRNCALMLRHLKKPSSQYEQANLKRRVQFLFFGKLDERRNVCIHCDTRLPWKSPFYQTWESDIVSAEIKRNLIDFTSNNFLLNLHFPPNMTFLPRVSGVFLFIPYCISPGGTKPQFPSLALMNTG